MGTFRTLRTTLRCSKCDASQDFDIQFKTADDAAMSEYGMEDLADDVAPGVYDGLADSFCAHCHRRWVEDEKRAHFGSLGDEVDAGLVTARKERSSVFYALRDPLVADLLSVAKQLLLATLEQTRDLLAGLTTGEAS